MVVLRLVNAVQKLSSTTGRVPLRARAVPEGSNQAESIHFLRTRLGEGSAEKCTVWSCLLLYWSLPAAYLDRVIGFLNYTPSSPPQPSSNGWTSRARSRLPSNTIARGFEFSHSLFGSRKSLFMGSVPLHET